MKLIDDRCARIQHNFYCLYLSLEYVVIDEDLQRVLGPEKRQNVFKAMHKPVLLSKIGQRALDIYEDHFVGFLTRRQGEHIEC